MNDKNQKYNKPLKKPEQKVTQGSPKGKVAPKAGFPEWYRYGILGGILVLTFWCYHYSIDNQFLNWDDLFYVVKNQYIKSFSAQNLRMMLFHGITPSNYHPFAMVSLALNYHFSQLSPSMYYLTNILIHLANIVLIFLLAEKLCKRLKLGSDKTLFISTLSALWFGIHPMHVESISWISERKDVLYSFFYLAGLITYLNYLDERKLKWYLITFLLFVASCLSKPMAVSFPLLLFSIDLLLGRKLEMKLFTEKILFFACSIFFGILAFFIQKDSGAVADLHTMSLSNRFFFACYGFVMYLVKLLFPFRLNAFYPYPDIRPTVALPPLFYVMPILAILISCVPLYFKWKKNENLFRITLFGLSFYFLNIVFVLQFVSCGDAIIADRYTYVAYFGIIFMIAYLIYDLLIAMPSLKYPIIIVLSAISIMFAVLCYGRTKVWHNPETFWTDVIAKSDMHSQLPYLNLANYYADSGKYDKAYGQYALLVRLDIKEPGVFRNLAMIYGQRKQYDSSLYCFSRALQYDSTDASIYTNRAVTYANMGKFNLALKDFSKAYSLDTTQDGLLSQRAGILSQLGEFLLAAKDYSTLIRRQPKELSFYINRGNAYLNGGNAQIAINDYLHILTLQPNNGECMYDLSLAYNKLGDNTNAFDYAEKANQNKFQVPADYLNRLQKSVSR
jgi:protein O-mannosyl-transferase